ncbi:MAG TPA: flagellar hook-length control protein FliK, partial [Gammaproteobacteria bacterium]|nr:flagellar hook-length control protein FliK [Gammaproteobacteria bacterium]
NLGNMRVQLQVHDNKVQAIFHMDHRGAAHLLDGNMHHLRAALHGQNLELEDVQVQVGSDGSQGQFDQGENGDHGPGQGGPDGGVAGRGGEASEAGEDARGRLVAVQTPGSLSLMA